MSKDKSRDDDPHTRRNLGRAGVLVVLGLLVQSGTLFWSHPTAFLFFAAFGVGFVGLGILWFLWTVLRSQPVSPVEG